MNALPTEFLNYIGDLLSPDLNQLIFLRKLITRSPKIGAILDHVKMIDNVVPNRSKDMVDIHIDSTVVATQFTRLINLLPNLERIECNILVTKTALNKLIEFTTTVAKLNGLNLLFRGCTIGEMGNALTTLAIYKGGMRIFRKRHSRSKYYLDFEIFKQEAIFHNGAFVPIYQKIRNITILHLPSGMFPALLDPANEVFNPNLDTLYFSSSLYSLFGSALTLPILSRGTGVLSTRFVSPTTVCNLILDEKGKMGELLSSAVMRALTTAILIGTVYILPFTLEEIERLIEGGKMFDTIGIVADVDLDETRVAALPISHKILFPTTRDLLVKYQLTYKCHAGLIKE